MVVLSDFFFGKQFLACQIVGPVSVIAKKNIWWTEVSKRSCLLLKSRKILEDRGLDIYCCHSRRKTRMTTIFKDTPSADDMPVPPTVRTVTKYSLRDQKHKPGQKLKRNHVQPLRSNKKLQSNKYFPVGKGKWGKSSQTKRTFLEREPLVLHSQENEEART